MASLNRTSFLANKANLFLSRRTKDGRFWGPHKLFYQFSRDWDEMFEKHKIDDADVYRWEKQNSLRARLKSREFFYGAQWENPETGWLRHQSIRVGVLARKIGMTTELDWWGRAWPVTGLQVQDNQVLDIKTREKNGYTALQIGAGLRKLSRTNNQLKGQFARAQVPPKQKIAEFRVTENAILPIGTRVLASHFKPGDYCDVNALSKGKGFQGVMKRWNFKGGRASHGSSKFHRKMGSAGSGAQDPGRVLPGKKMPGQMGKTYVTIRNLRVLKINNQDQILYVVGAVPGPKKGWVRVRDSFIIPPRKAPPFPTHFPDGPLRRYHWWSFKDPFAKDRLIDWDLKFAEAKKILQAAMKTEEGEEGDEDFDDDDEGDVAEGSKK
eukprot:TRINITY_DN7233_c0_g4_i2.p1 TRINITY_DN7233_c0_g4~~TRINITY_DN7233_c0_g4_i2.p1  ORF type:complete len:381 (+),score=82.99 TRINITY_DN7233_c0_g4_i2:90-1232(+)